MNHDPIDPCLELAVLAIAVTLARRALLRNMPQEDPWSCPPHPCRALLRHLDCIDHAIAACDDHDSTPGDDFAA